MQASPALGVERLHLATVTRVPDWHPEHATFEPFPVFAWVIHHPDGPILVDAGIGSGNSLIDDWYAPEVTELADALEAVAVDPGDIAAVVLSHLHFDHCGQHASLRAPVHVAEGEHQAAQEPYYTVPEWADIGADRVRLVRGDEEIAPGVRILATPGHTPGHQSVVVDGDPGPIVLGGQCAYRASEIRTGEPGVTNLHDTGWLDAARESIARVRSLRPCAVHLSHDDDVVYL